MVAENDGSNGGGPSEEIERQLKAYSVVADFLKLMEGSPNERAEKASEMLREFFQGNGPIALNARSALKAYCIAHKLDASSYIKPDLLDLLANRDKSKGPPVTS